MQTKSMSIALASLVVVSTIIFGASSFRGQVLQGIHLTDYWGTIRTQAETVAMGEFYREMSIPHMRLGILKLRNGGSGQSICQNIGTLMTEYGTRQSDGKTIKINVDSCNIKDGTFREEDMSSNLIGMKKYIQEIYPTMEIKLSYELDDSIRSGDYMGKDKVEEVKTGKITVNLKATSIPEEYRR